MEFDFRFLYFRLYLIPGKDADTIIIIIIRITLAGGVSHIVLV